MQTLPSEYIDKARMATLGLVSDSDLVVQAHKAARLGVAANSEDFARLAEAATKLAQRENA